MKNSEWGVVAYLSQSKYGKLGNKGYSGVNKTIYFNRSDQYITGCSYGAPSNETTDYGCHYTYEKSPEGTGASTTGTIYGIYDMVGGSWEYVMGIYSPNGKRYSGSNYSHNSGYTGLLEDGTTFTGKSWLPDKYYDLYSSNNVLSACNGGPCVSHALYETRGWYNDFYYEDYLVIPNTFAYRSGNYNAFQDTGIFSYRNYTGEGYSYYNNSFRITMIQN